MSEFQSYYRLLGVNTDASQLEIDEAFDEFTIQKHPSVVRRELEEYTRQCSSNGKTPDPLKLTDFSQRYTQAREQYQIAIHAYKTLSNPTSRADYDRTLPLEDLPVNLSFSQNEVRLGRAKKGDSVIDSFVITLVSGDVSKKRFGLKYPDWVSCTFTDTNGRLPITIQISVDTDTMAIGDTQGVIIFSVGKDEFSIPVSVSVYDNTVASGPVAPTVIAQAPPAVVTAPQPVATANGVVVDSVDIGPWRRKWIPIFVAVAIIIVLLQVLTPKPVDPFSQFCTRPVVEVSGLHINVTDNGLFMYGKLSAVLIVNGEKLDVPDIPSEIPVHTFVKTIVLSSVYVKTGDHAGETQICDKTMFPLS